MGNWLQLSSGGGYDFETGTIFGPFTMSHDVAHPLSQINRYAGHSHTPWPVAIHSVAVAQTLQTLGHPPDIVLAGLLHDAHEAVIGDIVTPVAWELGYDAVKALKLRVQSAIEARLEVPLEVSSRYGCKIINAVDAAALHVEKQLFMVPEPQPWNVPVPEHNIMLAMYDTVRELMPEAAADGGRSEFELKYSRLFGVLKT